MQDDHEPAPIVQRFFRFVDSVSFSLRSKPFNSSILSIFSRIKTKSFILQTR